MSGILQALFLGGGLAAPVNVSLPTITGSPLVGYSLTCSTGSWSGLPSPTITYQWQFSNDGVSGWSNITSATLDHYNIIDSYLNCYLRCNVTATNSVGASSSLTAATTIVQQLPFTYYGNEPVLSGGNSINTQIGDVLSCTQGTWQGTPAPYYITYQWKYGSANINGATSNTYTVGDLPGFKITCAVTAQSTIGTGVSTSNASNGYVGGPVNTSDVTIMPKAADLMTPGRNLYKESPGSWIGANGSYTFTSVWKSNSIVRSTTSWSATITNPSQIASSISSNAQNYVIQSSDVGYYIYWEVTVSGNNGSDVSSAISQYPAIA